MRRLRLEMIINNLNNERNILTDNILSYHMDLKILLLKVIKIYVELSVFIQVVSL